MSDPFSILDIDCNGDDAVIRARYLELVRRFPPEQAPERFAAIRDAFERVKTQNDRLRWRLFEAGRHDTLDSVIEKSDGMSPRRRPTLAELLAAAGER
jgi:hypothetical protein